MDIKILSINAKGLNHPAKRASLWKTALAHNSDIICVQEMYFAQDKTPYCQNKLFPHIYKTCYSKKQRGVLIAIRDTVNFQLQDCILDPEGRYVILLCTIDNTVYTIATVYAPNQRQMAFLKATLKKIKSVQQGHLLICTDFNLVPDNDMDSSSGPKRFASPLTSFLTSNDLYDVWRCCHVAERDYTFLSLRHNTYSRIDLFLVDKWLLQNIHTSRIHTITWSDHAPISVQITNKNSKPQSYLWRVNNFLLQNQSNATFLSQKLEEFFTTNGICG